MQDALIVILVIALIFAFGISALILFLYFKEKSKYSTQLHTEIQKWRETELKPIVDKERLLALERFNQWRQQDLEQIRKQENENAIKTAQVQLSEWKLQEEKLLREDAIKKSNSVNYGKVSEALAPYLPNFGGYNPKDARFLGSPIDFVVFDGLEDEVELRKIVFIEVKSGASHLTTRERHVRNAILAGKVEWLECRLAGEESLPADGSAQIVGPV